MEKQIELAIELAEVRIDLRVLLDIEILAIGGGETVVGLY